jgi:hypothetical protein
MIPHLDCYMRHNESILMALTHEPNDTVFQKTLALSDYYYGCKDWEYPLGLIQGHEVTLFASGHPFGAALGA